MHKWIPLIIALSLGLVLYAAIGKDPTKLETARLNDPIPNFSLNELKNAQRVLTQDDLKGQVALLNVWATWCPSCRVEHGYLVKLANEGVPIIGLNYKDDRDAAISWLKQLGDPYQFNVFDPEGKLGFDLGVYGAPETYLIDKQGVVRYRHVGVVDEKVWQQILQPRVSQLSQ